MLCASTAVAQSPIRVEQGIADVDSNALVRVDTWVDFRQEIGWESVFRLESTDRFGRENVMFARRSGAVSAVFPRSVYSWSESGPTVEVPPGTVFHIGGFDEWASAPSSPARSPMWIDRRVDLRSVSSATPNRPQYRRDDRANVEPVQHAASRALAAEVARESLGDLWQDEGARRMAVAMRLAQAREVERQWEAQRETAQPATPERDRPERP